MSEQNDVMTRLQALQIPNGICWAYGAATSRTLADYSEDAGHDASWLGQTRHVLFRDRLDRVFSCGRYTLRAGADDGAGLDLVRSELSEREIATMPRIPAEIVRRSDLSLSPGWAHADTRFLLASAAVGKVESLPWPRRSPTKQLVAVQSSPEPPPTLFDELSSEEIGGLAALADGALDLDTFVVAHSLDPVRQLRELVFGRPQLNRGGGPAWHWYENLLSSPLPPAAQQPDRPAGTHPDGTPDAEVRLRTDASKKAPKQEKAAGNE